LALAGVFLLLVVLLNLPASVAERLKLAVGGLFMPLFGLRAATNSALDRASYRLLPRDVLVAELEDARRQIAELRIEARRGADALAENARLRTSIGSAPRGPWNRRLARVVGREPTTWWRSVHIDLGSRDGARPDLVVITPDGLVGRVSHAGLDHSQVALVGDAECGVSAVVVETRDLGIIKAGQDFASAGGLLEISFLQNTPGVMAGQHVVTSGLGGVFPSGLPVGVLVDSRPTEGGLFTTGRLKPSAALNRLEEVWVLFP
jgi:rod shape-determining protein MreC